MINCGRTIHNIGSKVTKPAMQKAMATTLRSTIPSPSVAKSVQTISQSKVVHKGSAAGLKSATSLHLQRNNSGYFNPAHQTARFGRKKPLPQAIINKTTFMNNYQSNVINDSRLTRFQDSSAAKLIRRTSGE